ncbi:hypothetical protein EUC41_20160 [Achromobacter denitrificans]|nr:hypothetical protein EUC41_20160 [Achromobacter denitrificans]
MGNPRRTCDGPLVLKLRPRPSLQLESDDWLLNIPTFNVARMLEIVPTNDLKRIYDRYAGEIEHSVVATLRSGWWLNGDKGRRFSESFAAFVGTSHCIPVANGTELSSLLSAQSVWAPILSGMK